MTEIAPEPGPGGSADPPRPPAPRPEPRGFRRELTPTWLATATLLAGQRPPDLTRPFRAVYLGLGTGATAAVVAAVHPDAEVWAWDPRPGPVEATRRLRDAAVLPNLAVHERPVLPLDLGGGPTDLVVVAGLFDSVDDDLRARITDAIGTSLRPGGIACVTYKTTVGWVEIAPVVRLMRYVALRSGVPPIEAVPRVLDLLAALRAGDAKYLTERPVVAAWLDDLARTEDAVIAAEYLEHELRPVSHAQVVEWLSPTGSVYAGSAALTTDLDQDVPVDLAEMVATAPTGLLREAYRDLAARRVARADVFRLGTAPLDPAEQIALVGALQLVALPSVVGDPLARFEPSSADAVPTLRRLLDAGVVHPRASRGEAVDARNTSALERVLALRVLPDLGSAVPVEATA